MVRDNSSMFIIVMFCIFCGMNSILSITSSIVGTQEADAAFGVNMTIAVLNFLIGTVVLSTYLEERKKKERANQESLEENSYILEIPSSPPYDSPINSQDSISLAPPYDSIYFENSVDSTNSMDSANSMVLDISS
jgi:hypothetical protein